ncbi:GNAT family N-acetyltransferase [Pasteuria penetrans]|uniref:GNAT family N-acetyltransferase n=1 Tax=Pasteuria penetrans TaxID=86005 RepID=UPI000FA428B9|nr:GNAT family N-acetyltransferase [Pasteuria penetrans]
MGCHIETERLILRDWEYEDLEPLWKMNQDPRVREFSPVGYTGWETEDMVRWFCQHWWEYGFTSFACESKENATFIGHVGLVVCSFEAHFTPNVEIGWRLDARYWGRGYATEAARAVLAKSFTDYGLNEVVSLTVPNNMRSRRVMEKINLLHDEDGDFQHPYLPQNHPLSWHVLYRLSKGEYIHSTDQKAHGDEGGWVCWGE